MQVAAAQSEEFQFTFLETGESNQEVYMAPLAPDSASKDYLGDASGLAGCGDRIYELKTQGQLVKIEPLTGEISL